MHKKFVSAANVWVPTENRGNQKIPGDKNSAQAANTKDETSLKQAGSVVSITGSVVDIRFDRYLPPIHTILYVGR